MQVINTNILSLIAQNNLNKNQDTLTTSIQRLSSGLRINSAKDDAAGLAIADRFTAQINGLNQAVRNANDGISLAQTADGALGEVTNNLQRIRELAVQAANSTNSASDRAALQTEVSQRIAEVDRIAGQTQFNGLNLLDGSFSSQQFQVGANANQTIAINQIGDVRTSQLGQSYGASLAGTTLTASTGITAAGQFTIQVGNTTTDIFTGAGGNAITGDAKSLAAAINASGVSGLHATAAATTSAAGAYSKQETANGNADLTINGITMSVALVGSSTDVQSALSAINNNSAATGVSATYNGGGLTLTATDGRNISVSIADASSGGSTGAKLGDVGLSGFGGAAATAASATTYGSYSVSYTGTDTVTVGGTAAAGVSGLASGATNASATGVAVHNIDISTLSGANSALASVDAALGSVDGIRASLGALQNRFTSAVANLSSTAQNLTASRSRIQDADFAAETANMTRAQILQQAGTAMVAQANSLPQSVLTLLK